MKEFFDREPVKRAIRTFIQASAGYIAVHIAVSDFESEHAIKALFAAAVAAGIAAMMNLDIAERQEQREQQEQQERGDDE